MQDKTTLQNVVVIIAQWFNKYEEREEQNQHFGLLEKVAAYIYKPQVYNSKAAGSILKSRHNFSPVVEGTKWICVGD